MWWPWLAANLPHPTIPAHSRAFHRLLDHWRVQHLLTTRRPTPTPPTPPSGAAWRRQQPRPTRRGSLPRRYRLVTGPDDPKDPAGFQPRLQANIAALETL